MTTRDPTQNPDFLHFSVDRVLPYPAPSLFDIAADVERYPEFLPGWIAVRTRASGDRDYETDQVLSFGPVRERFSSQTHLEPPACIRVVSHSRTFSHFEVNWRFESLADGSCRVHLNTHVGFKSRYVKKAVGMILPRSVKAILTAFEERARQLAGRTDTDLRDAEPLANAN